MHSSPSSRNRSRQSGFSLVEVLIATFILTVGLVSVAHLLAVSTTMHADARQATASALYAQTKLDELSGLSFTDSPVQIAGADSLSTNTASYFDMPASAVTRRWMVRPGPTANTRHVTVRVVNNRARRYGAQLEVSTIIRQW